MVNSVNLRCVRLIGSFKLSCVPNAHRQLPALYHAYGIIKRAAHGLVVMGHPFIYIGNRIIVYI